MTGQIFNIQKFCINDGPGIRTTVFFKGCPIRCLWCHNPESQVKEKQIMFYPDKCTGCGRCAGLTPDNTDFICFSDAKEIVGKTISADEAVEEVMKDFLFYENSGGGVTLSGGEPLMQLDFAIEILKKCKEKGVHTAIETCGFAPTEKVLKIAEYTDLFLYDYKETDPEKHKLFTGVDNKLILKNLFELDKLGKDIILRCPIIPEYNDTEEHFDGIIELTNSLKNIREVNIEPYHSFGEGKYEALGLESTTIETPSEERTKEIIDHIQAKTAVTVKKP